MNRPYVSFQEVLKRELRNPEFKAEWERTYIAREVTYWLIKYRMDHELTQTALGRAVGMKQQAIGRLEMGETVPTLETLRTLCTALGSTITISIDKTGDQSVTFE